jgi:hypothetical protein
MTNFVVLVLQEKAGRGSCSEWANNLYSKESIIHISYQLKNIWEI